MNRPGARGQAIFVFVVAACAITVVCVGVLVGLSPRESWWWDSVWLAQAQVALNMIGAGLATGAVVYAWKVATRQFAMMEDQDVVIRQQLKMLHDQRDISIRIEVLESKQESLLQRQGEIAASQGKMIERQSAIAEIQHKTWLEIQERYVKLEVTAILRGEDDKQAFVELALRNTGTKTARDVNWAIFIPNQSTAGIAFSQMTGRKKPEPTELGTGEMAQGWSGEVQRPVFQKRQRRIASFDIAKVHAHDFRIFWNVNNDDGEFPQLEGANPDSVVVGEIRVKIGRGGSKTTFAADPA
jgi:hypothetical protein